MGKVADPLRELVGSLFTNDMALYKDFMSIADEIDREHERRMDQCGRETKRAFARYLRSVTAEYERGHKRKPWDAQQRMALDLEVCEYELKEKDGEETVRCRDCQYGYQHDCKRYPTDKRYMGKWYCIVWGDGMQGEWTRADGYCHRAKRRGNKS